MLFILLQLIMFAVAFYHVLFILFTKVEESFNMQAVHDLLFHVTNFSQYDHLEFPGVVPRTFIGPLVLATLSAPLRLFAYPYQMSKVHFQVTTRIAMAILVCVGHIKLAYSLQTALGNNAAKWYMAITISQFHLMFYASRTLPNIFALIGFLFMMAYYMREEYYKAVVASAFTAVIFRLETSILFGLLFIPVLIENRRRGIKLVLHGSAFALIFLGLTVSIDSFFWNKLVWPEGSVWWYNVVLNKSHNWGVSPFLWYFYSALPRAMLASSLLIPFTLISSTNIRHMSMCALVYIAIFSFLPHKELRFIFYAIVLLNICVAWVSAQILALRARFTLHTMTAAFVLVHPLINILASIFFIRAAMFNYPGGEAIMHMHTMLKADGLAMKRLQIHIDTYAAQTGVTRFLQSNPYWQYNKTEGLKPEDMWPFDYLLIGHEHNVSGLAEEYAATHRTIYQYSGFNGVLMRMLEEFPYFQVHYETRPQVALMKKVLIQGPSGTARVLEPYAAVMRFGGGCMAFLSKIQKRYRKAWTGEREGKACGLCSGRIVWIGTVLTILMYILGLTVPHSTPQERQYEQALHDILYHGLDLEKYGHWNAGSAFSFILPLCLAVPIYPFFAVAQYLRMEKWIVLLAARCVVVTAATMIVQVFIRSLIRKVDLSMAIWFLCLTCSQYCSVLALTRFSQDTVSTLFVLIILKCLYDYNKLGAAFFTVIAILVAHHELITLFLPMLFCLLKTCNQRSVRRAAYKKIACVVVIVMLFSIAVDSFFWDRLVWHQGHNLLYSFNFKGAVTLRQGFWNILTALLICCQWTVLCLYRLISFKTLWNEWPLTSAFCFLLHVSILHGNNTLINSCAAPIFNLAFASAYACDQKRKKLLPSIGRIILLLNIFTSLLIGYSGAPNEPTASILMEIRQHPDFANASDWSLRILMDKYTADLGYSPFYEPNSLWRYEIGEIPLTERYHRQFYHIILVGADNELQAKVDDYDESHKLQRVKKLTFPKFSSVPFTVFRTPPFIRMHDGNSSDGGIALLKRI